MEDELVRQINDALARSGERERFKQLVREKLETSNWFTQVKAEAEREIKSRNTDDISPQELAALVYPKATEMIPTQLKKELQEDIKRFLDAHIKIA